MSQLLMVELKVTFRITPQVKPEAVPHEDVAVVQPLFCLNKVSAPRTQV